MEAKIQFKDNWEETRQRYDAWLQQQKTDRPLMNLQGRLEEPRGLIAPMEEPEITDRNDRYLNVENRFPRMMNRYDRTLFLAESYPSTSAGFGSPTMAVYLGSEPIFAENTVWHTHWINSYENLELVYDENQKYWKMQVDMLKRLKELTVDTDIILSFPDIVENLDILAAMRGTTPLLMDLYDFPDEVKKALKQITDLYTVYYNHMYDIIRRPDGSSSYGAYSVYGSGKSAKLQSDFAAMISPEHFEEFVMPCLRQQCEDLDSIVFHLDGVEMIPHLDMLLSLDKLGAIQWTPPPGTAEIKAANERWFPLYKRIRDGGKGLWFSLVEYGPDDCVAAADKIIKEIGPDCLYLAMPQMEAKQAEAVLIHAEKNWKS
ncbi:MAG: hypothetical protein FWH12_05000 [Treponema sp.]|nr:hypothetical protein [Treponema sp.]